ncbi:hypothetical protein ACS98V_00080 [Escherichia coli]|uniref:hypothetical protein n=1 Tax=Escherichia coli TaxID=562 RepID=UPI003F765D0A
MKIKLTSIIAYTIISIIIALGLVYTNRPRIFVLFSIFHILGVVVILYYFNWLKLNEKNLLKQPLFIASIIIPLEMFILYGLWAWKGHSLDFTSEGFNQFLDISKLPLLILASSVPLASIVNNIHRTTQTENQIEKTQKQINLVIEKNKTDCYLLTSKKLRGYF